MTDTNQEVRETPELLPCPFCGAPGFIEEGSTNQNFMAGCIGCQCNLGERFSSDGGAFHMFKSGALAAEAWNTRAALASAPPPAVPDAVGVRATRLTWEEPSKATNMCWTAKSEFGTYSVVNEDGWYATLDDAPWGKGFDWSSQDMQRDTLYTAQSAAQADFDRRILSSIEPTPSPEPQAYYDAILSCLDRYQPMAEKAERRDLVEFMDQLRDEIGNRAPLCKLNRWLGYIQGVLIENGHTDVLIERDWSRPLFRPLDYGERLIGYALPEDVYTGGPRSVPLETWQNNSLFEGLFTQPVYSNVSHEPQASNAGAVEALRSCIEVIDDYLAYRHDGDPWSEDARLMGEMEINHFARDGGLERARAALSTPEPQTGERDGGMADVSIRSLLASSHAEADHWKRKYETEHALHVGAIRERNAAHEAAERRLAEVEERAREDAARLDWMEANPGAELAKVGGWDESDDYRWAVHIVRGGRNDREWNEIASGATARAALDAALRAKPEAQAIVGKEAQS